MPYQWIPQLADHCERRDVYFLSTPFDERSVSELTEYVPAFKIASLSASHAPLLKRVGETGYPVILSTGAQDMNEVAQAVSTLREAGTTEIGLLQCVSAYPTPLEDANVRVVQTLRERFDCPSGLSDHTMDPTVAPTAAVALGGSILEKHFTLDSSRDGLDHSYALEPEALSSMIDAVRKTERVLGEPKKRILEVENDLRTMARRSLQAKNDIDEDSQIERGDVAVLRSGEHTKGIDPKFLDVAVGAVATEPIPEGEGITWDNIDADIDRATLR
jgi:N-acetylneuraminate synthase